MDAVTVYLTSFASYHAYVQALLIVGASLFLALVVIPFLSNIVRFFTRKTKSEIDDELVTGLRGPVFYAITLGGIAVALTKFAFSPTVLYLIDKGIQTLYVLLVALAAMRVVRIVLTGLIDIRSVKAVNRQTLPLFRNVGYIIIIAAGVYALFLVWGINVTAWLASAGIIGIAVGFAAKDTLSNIISGIFILTDKPYSVGDFVELGSGTVGIVSAVGLRSTRIRTFADEEVTIPNMNVANAEITNKSTGPDTGRVLIELGVAYGSDMKKVEKTLIEIMNEHEKVLEDPEPAVYFTDFGDSALHFTLLCRVRNPLDVYGVKSDLRHTIDERFRTENIEIPFPQRDVHMKK